MSRSASLEQERQDSLRSIARDAAIKDRSIEWLIESCKKRYSYNFDWLGRPIIQYPQDMLAMQEIVWRTKPELIIETGIAHGGSLIFHASMLELVGGEGQVLGIDVDIREPNRRAIEEHPMSRRITMLQGSSTDPEIVSQVVALANGKRRVMVVLDSNHTHDHVLQELNLYAPLVTRGSYLIVLDTVIEDLPEDFFPDRPWGRGNNPKTAVWQFLAENDRFEIDPEYQEKLLISVAPDGYLRCIKD